jgi:hypothetical protein
MARKQQEEAAVDSGLFVQSKVKLKGEDEEGNVTALEFEGTETGMQVRSRTDEWEDPDTYITFLIPWEDWRVVNRKIPNPVTKRRKEA